MRSLVRLVLFELIMPETATYIECYRNMRGLLLAEDIEQHRVKP